MGGFFSDFEAVRTESSDCDAPRRLKSTRTLRKRSTKLDLMATTGCWTRRRKNLTTRFTSLGLLLESSRKDSLPYCRKASQMRLP